MSSVAKGSLVLIQNIHKATVDVADLQKKNHFFLHKIPEVTIKQNKMNKIK